jgi:hypothetical protein
MQILGIEMTAEFRSRLRVEEEKARKYESLHRYSLDQFSIPIELFRKDFADIMERFGFPDGSSGGTSEG